MPEDDPNQKGIRLHRYFELIVATGQAVLTIFLRYPKSGRWVDDASIGFFQHSNLVYLAASRKV